jgi:sugar/nucleoside kinase (ribokinase family)
MRFFTGPAALRLPPASGRAWDVIAIGENSLDFVARLDRWPAPDSKSDLRELRVLPGGQVATAAAAAARLGARTRYLGVVGTDESGQRVRTGLAGTLEATLVECGGARTRTAIVLVDNEGRRTVLEDRDPALQLRPEQVPPGWVESGRILMVDATQPDAALDAARRARNAGLAVIVDVDQPGASVDLLIAAADVIIAPATFVLEETGSDDVGEALGRLDARYAPSLTVATLGSDGAVARCQGRDIRVPAVRMDVVDTTGAGDAFRGGFAAAWIELGDDAPVESLLSRAALVAALNCRGLGALGALPTRGELETWL